MKIALVSAYDYAHPGGVTEHVRHLAAGLRRRGHDVTVFAPCSDRDVAVRGLVCMQPLQPAGNRGLRLGIAPSLLRMNVAEGRQGTDQDKDRPEKRA